MKKKSLRNQGYLMMMKIKDIKDKNLKEKIINTSESYKQTVDKAKKYALDKLELDLKNNLITKEEYLIKRKELGL